MLSIFPDLLIYNLLGITIIRIVIGFIGVYIGFRILSKRNELVQFVTTLGIPFAIITPWILFIVLIISGTLMVIGLYTQIACIVLAYLFLKVMIIDFWSQSIEHHPATIYLGLILISLAFLFLGPGAFAFDLPF